MKYKASLIIEADDEAQAEDKLSDMDFEVVKDSLIIEEAIEKDIYDCGNCGKADCPNCKI